MKVSFYTLGCRLNQAETAIIAKSLRNKGYQIVEFGEPVDLTVINTCTVTEQADAKCRQIIRKSLRTNPDTIIAGNHGNTDDASKDYCGLGITRKRKRHKL